MSRRSKIKELEQEIEILRKENESKRYFKEYLKYQRNKYYPSSLTLHMYMLFASHEGIGTEEKYDF